jgi:hypothetical protein
MPWRQRGMANPLETSGIRQQSEPGHNQSNQEKFALHLFLSEQVLVQNLTVGNRILLAARAWRKFNLR